MRTIKGDVEEIRKILDVIEKKDAWRNQDRPENVEMISWMVQHIEYTIRIAASIQNSPGRNKSYAAAISHMRSHLESTIGAVRIWQTEGVAPGGSK